MTLFTPAQFFNLSHYEHVALFDQNQPVWAALLVLQKYLKDNTLWGIQTNVPRGTFFENRELVSIGEGSVIEEGAFIRGPCIIGKNAQIRNGAYIRGGVVAGDDCVFGHASEFKNCVLLNGAQAGHFAYVGDSILGNRVNLGAGVKCANLRLDRGEVFVRDGENRVATGLKKFGAVIGDEVSLGCNAVTNPGTLIGPRAHCSPCVSLCGFIEAGASVGQRKCGKE